MPGSPLHDERPGYAEEHPVSALFGLSLIGIFCVIGMALRRWQ
ncbi:hypothetical protein [Brachybacterium paraconglomeratum]